MSYELHTAAVEVYEDGKLCAVVTVCDVCAEIDVRDKIHTAESWAELSAAIGRAIAGLGLGVPA